MSILTENAGLELTATTLRERGWLQAIRASNGFTFWHKRIRTVHFEMPMDNPKQVRVFQYGKDPMYFDVPDTILELEGLCKEYYKRYTGFEL